MGELKSEKQKGDPLAVIHETKGIILYVYDCGSREFSAIYLRESSAIHLMSWNF